MKNETKNAQMILAFVEVMRVAQEYNVIDPYSAYVLGSEHGEDYSAAVAFIVEATHNERFYAPGANKAVIAAANSFWKAKHND